ncbi:MAG: phosphonate ABC transporter, permease protein PhnE [Deltaproteobacteria bacterium]|nr:MAG: phosphonate ABC transporter, permease protein PhnE [Deltaproteobacteria bacterium]
MRAAQTVLPEAKVFELERRYPFLFRLSGRQKFQRLVWAGSLILLILFSIWKMDVSLAALGSGAAKLGWMFALLFPPAHHGWLDVFLYALLETLAMAFLGTLFASLAAIPLGFLGAKNIVSNSGVHFVIRRFFDVIRGVDALIWALIFINVVGLGPFAGVLAIAVSDMGVLAKLFAEAIENSDKDQIEGVRSTGAKRIQILRFGILPQVLPVILSNSLYYFESNTRSATILGVVGAGGIGLQLADRIRINNWDEVGFLVIMILVTVALIDTLSREIRMRVIHQGRTRP